MTTVLVTCAGSGVGYSVLDSLSLTSENYIIGCDLKEYFYGANLCHKTFKAPRFDDPNYLDFILNLCEKHNVDIVILGHDQELLLFSNNSGRFKEVSTEVLVSLSDVIEISRDKYRWSEYFGKYGCSIVTTKKVSEFKKNPDTNFFPAIVKPAGGSASQGITILHNTDDLSLVNDEDIIQPYLFPQIKDSNYNAIRKAVDKGQFVQLSEISIQLVYSLESKLEGIFISNNKLEKGIPMHVDTIDPENFEYLNEVEKFDEVLRKHRVKGPVNLQGRITDSGLVFFEMNMRFTGITGNRAKLGFNEVSFLINNFLGIKKKLNGYSTNKIGVRQVACTAVMRREEPDERSKVYTILGGGGYIGSNFAKELIESKNYKSIYFICRDKSFERYKETFQYEHVSIIKESDSFVESCYAMSDIVINFASSRANESESNIYDSILFQYYQSQILKKCSVPFIINISSQSVYDQSNDISKNEDEALRIENPYAFQKYIGEEFFNEINKNCPASKVLSIRFSRVVGSTLTDVNEKGFFKEIIKAIINETVLEIPFPKNNINLIDIRDVIECLIYFTNYKNKSELPSLLNAGGENISIEDYCKRVANEYPSKISKIKFGESDSVKSSSKIDIGLAQKLGWSPNYTIEDTIKYLSRDLT